MRRFIAVLALGLAACGSREPSRSQAESQSKRDRAPQAAAPVAPAADSRRVLAAFGDSLTAGFGADPGQSYPDYLQKLIDAKGYPWRVVNFGVSGETSTDGLARITEVVAAKPAVVVLELGANDGLRGIPVERMRENLDEIVAQLKSSGCTVVLAGMTLPPNYGREYISRFENVYRDIARKHNLRLIPFLLQGVAENRTLMQGDGLHPTGEGNRRVARTVYDAIEPVLKQ